MLNEPYVSSDFTVEDIRRIRNYNSARHAQMSHAEIIADNRKSAEEMLKRLAERKAKTTENRAI